MRGPAARKRLFADKYLNSGPGHADFRNARLALADVVDVFRTGVSTGLSLAKTQVRNYLSSTVFPNSDAWFPSWILLRYCRMRVRVDHKLADSMDGIDLSYCAAGDLIDLPERDARIMVAEHWASFARRATDSVALTGSGASLVSTIADSRRLLRDRRHSSRPNDVYQRLRDKCEQIEQERRRLRRRATDHQGESSTTRVA